MISNHIIKFDKLIDIVKESKEKYDIEDITLTGGEPSLQKGLVAFNNTIHNLGLGIIIFSGIYRKNLNQQLVDSVDLLIDDHFVNSNVDNERI